MCPRGDLRTDHTSRPVLTVVLAMQWGSFVLTAWMQQMMVVLAATLPVSW